MSAHMKKHLTKVAIGKKEFNIPQKEAQAILSLVESIHQSTSNNGGIPSEVIFKEVAKNRPKGAVYLRGIRTREDVSQKELEKLTGIPISNISKYESGSRKITDPIAKKLAKALNIDYRKLLKI